MSVYTKILATSALFAAVTAASAGEHLTEVSYGTNWVAQAEHGGYYQALADGTYEACGLDVTIVPGGPQVNNRALLMAGKIDFYMGGNMLNPWNALVEGIPLKVVAAHFQKEPQVLLTHPGRVSSFEEVPELDSFIIGDGGYTSFFQWLITDYGFDPAKRVPYTFNSAVFINDVNSVQQGYVTSEPYAIEREAGWAPDVWLLADYGFSTPSTTVETMESTIAEHPEIVRCFVEASSIGWATYLYGDPSAGNALIQEINPDMTDELIASTIEKLKEYGIVDSGIALEKGIGAIDEDNIAQFYDRMVSAGVIEDGIDVKSSYTLEFANSGAALETKKLLLGQ